MPKMLPAGWASPFLATWPDMAILKDAIYCSALP
jgi:hypothetical protein